jgi:hypothetical protein
VHNPDEALDHLNSLIPRELFQRGNVKVQADVFLDMYI